MKYHSWRVQLLGELEQILRERTLTFGKNTELLRKIRNGQLPFDEIEQCILEKQQRINEQISQSCLPDFPPKDQLDTLYRHCLKLYIEQSGFKL